MNPQSSASAAPAPLDREATPLDGIAIIGMAGRFPGAPDLDTFWRNLVEGKDNITRWVRRGDEPADFVAAHGVLEDAAMFDAEYFGISPREAERMDPQHRVFLEACSNALEDAGYVSADFEGEIGLFAGCSLNTYLLANLAQDRAFLDELTSNYQVGEFQVALGNDKDFLTTRVAYKLNLRGPCVTVQSACATSLVAICQASQALLNFQCDMALAGGVSITFPQERGHVYQDGGIVSEDGHCRPFDAKATGTVFGHGVGVVVLKRLDDALRDGDSISAVLRGFAVNNDGSAKAGYMAPGVDGQTRVIAAAQAMAGVSADSISYVEAHGTATPLGDPIEIAALTRAFRTETERVGFCAVGTAKGNVGHLDCAAGVTGVIKTVLSMRHRTLPGLAHFETANPNIELDRSPFYFKRTTAPWTGASPLRAGVSAFGVGGVNAHVVLEEAPASTPEVSSRSRQVLVVSGRTEAAALQSAANLAGHLAAHPDISLADAAFTLAQGRRAHAFRIAVAASDVQDAGAQLTAIRGATTAKATKVAMQFSGQATQSVGMGRELYRTEPAFARVIDECAAELFPQLGFDLRDLLFADVNDLAAAARLDRTEFAQPAIYMVELALTELWKAWGVVPFAVTGHSLGEYGAATLAGVFTRSEGLHLVALRGRMMQAQEAGAMLSVPIAESDIAAYLNAEVSLAAVNTSRTCVLSGTMRAIDALETRLRAEGSAPHRLRTSHAFHSAMMEPMLAQFAAEVAKLKPQAPRIPIVSSVTGDWLTAAEATSPRYWATQCRLPVRFGEAHKRLIDAGCDLLLEVGPGRVLTSLALQQPATQSIAAIASLPPRQGDGDAIGMEDALAELWAAGVEVDWRAVHAGEHRQRIPLPTYPFERKLHWVAPPISSTTSVPLATIEQVPGITLAEPSVASRNLRLQVEIARVFADLSGIETKPEEAQLQFLELGFDSLFLTQATQSLQKTFGVKITFRQLMETCSTIAGLAHYLDSVLPVEAFADPVAESPAATLATPRTDHMTGLERLIEAQTATMTRLCEEQLATLRMATAGQLNSVRASSKRLPSAAPGEATEVRHAAFRSSQAKVSQELDANQTRYIGQLIERYVARTSGSKRLTAAGRPQLADPRAVAGFRPQWKEMVYPLITERALGSRLWDVDGNEYIDIVNGYGCILFGHSPSFVVDAVREQLERGVAIGPQTPLAAEVAALICELTGNERVTFCNTGSEAVMAAIRVARTVTGRDRLVYFTGDYHGTFDEVLIRNTPRGSAPVAPGIPLDNVTNVVVLEYGADESLEYLRSHADEIAAVLIEPVQTRHPDVQPFDFIRSVRTITQETGAAMILDEVVTGFRLAPGGVQQLLGIRADLCTYGKVIGGGHPIGVLSGRAMYLDALDGGAWQYGDDSGPEVGVTFFAGTFVRHPLALAAAKAVLLHLRDAGPSLQRELNARTARLAESLDRFFTERGLPSRIHHFASWFYFTFPPDARLGSLFYYAMRARGIHIQEGYPCFLTTAHSDADIDLIETAFRESIVEMQQAGVLPGQEAGPDVSAAPTFHPFALPEAPVRIPLTEPQQEVFLAAALNDEANCAFNESLTLHLRGPVRLQDLFSALRFDVARHDALRSTIDAEGESMRIEQHEPAREIEIASIDLSELTDAAQEQAFAETIEREGRTPFDLNHGPLLRMTCLRLAENHVALVLTAHHIVFDGWSANQFLEEVGQVYSNGRAARLTRLLPFSSFAAREATRRADGEFIANEAYWVQRFEGRSPLLELPADRPRPTEKSYRGRTHAGRLGPELYTALKRASTRSGCTLYVTLLSAFQILLHRLTAQDEVVVGISTAGQALIEDASLVGHCVHFLPMLSDLREGMTVKEHLQATKTALLDAYDHQEFTYGSLLRKLKLTRVPGRLPLIEVQFNLERVGANVVFDGLAVDTRANAKQFVNTDLFLNVIEGTSELELQCDFNSDLFDEPTIDRWMSAWAELLRDEIARPDARVDDLRLLGDGERVRVVEAWNGTALDLGAFEPMVARFLRCAEADPERTALECGGVRWSYAELARYSLGLAERLVDQGLRPGELVALCVERSPEMVGAVLAVMLAGAAYVPLDPRHPAQRLEMVLEDSGARLLLTAGPLELKTSARIVDLSMPVMRHATGFTPPVLKEDSLAYVIYTSGSTGKPKGVAVEHGALMNLLRAMEREPGLHADDVLVAITTLAFDIAGLELLLPLMTGAKLVVATDAEVLDGRLLLALLERSRATVLQATPGAWRVLIDAGWSPPGGPHNVPLKALCGGEALPRELADRLLERSREVWNMYGPTETTIWSSATRVRPGSGALRIGSPIANTQFHVLDQRRQPQPIGVTGELCIGGAGLARGYWNRAALTAEKFIANPFGAGRLYATGDLARRRDDGSIELLGRADFQVKIRGYRIELAEIEANIAHHPQVKEAVVTSQTAAAGSVRLVAYVATGCPLGEAGIATLADQLKALLNVTLPEYMVPAAYVVLERLPRTPNGKIDRKSLSALLAAEELPLGPTRTFTAAATEIQKKLADIWCDVLELNTVGIRDSIFELGADSLLIFRIAARSQRAGLAINATQIFQHRTIERLCEAVEQTTSSPLRVTTRIAAASRESYRLHKPKVDA